MSKADDSDSRPRRQAPRADVLEVGGRALRPATLMLGHGYDPELSQGSVKLPLFQTSTYVFQSAAAGKRHFAQLTDASGDAPHELIYSRFNGPNQEILERRLAVWDGAEAALCFASGMAAVATLMLAHARPGDVIVHSSPLYAASETLADRLLGEFGVQSVDFPAGADDATVAAALRAAAKLGRIALIYLESPANPTNMLVDIEAVRRLRDELCPARPPIAIDNTFLGPLWQQPLRHGADIAVYSLTKYVGGHSDLVAGGIVGPAAMLQPVRQLRNLIGTIADSHTAWLLLRSLETLELRMTRAGENAARVCEYLRRHPKVERVGYLGFVDGRQAEIWRRHCAGAGSTFSLYLRGGEREAFAFLDALRVARLAVSLGGTETLASAPAAMTHLSVPAARKQKLGITPNLVRLSIGIEDADDLIADFAQALQAV